MATEREQRREQMPVSSALWDEFVAAFGLPEWFVARENGREIVYRTKQTNADKT